MGGFYPARFALPFSLCLSPRSFFLSFVRLALAVISRFRADFYNCLGNICHLIKLYGCIITEMNYYVHMKKTLFSALIQLAVTIGGRLLDALSNTHTLCLFLYLRLCICLCICLCLCIGFFRFSKNPLGYFRHFRTPVFCFGGREWPGVPQGGPDEKAVTECKKTPKPSRGLGC